MRLFCIFKRVCLISFMVGACSSEPRVEYKRVHPKASASPTPSQWALIAPLVDRHCQPCHSVSPRVDLSSEASWKGSRAYLRVLENTMPPAGGLDDLTKTQLENYK